MAIFATANTKMACLLQSKKSMFHPIGSFSLVAHFERSIKAVLLHNGKEHPSIPIAYSTQLSKT